MAEEATIQVSGRHHAILASLLDAHHKTQLNKEAGSLAYALQRSCSIEQCYGISLLLVVKKNDSFLLITLFLIAQPKETDFTLLVAGGRNPGTAPRQFTRQLAFQNSRRFPFLEGRDVHTTVRDTQFYYVCSVW